MSVSLTTEPLKIELELGAEVKPEEGPVVRRTMEEPVEIAVVESPETVGSEAVTTR